MSSQTLYGSLAVSLHLMNRFGFCRGTEEQVLILILILTLVLAPSAISPVVRRHPGKYRMNDKNSQRLLDTGTTHGTSFCCPRHGTLAPCVSVNEQKALECRSMCQ